MSTGQIALDRPTIAPLGGDRIYAAMRWLVLLIVMGFGAAQFGIMPWPPSPTTPASLAIWGYALFTVAASAILFAPSLGRIVPWLYAGDLIGFAALTYTAPGRSAAYENIFFLPLVAAALRCSERRVILFSAAAAVLSVLLGVTAEHPDALAVISRVGTFVALPWLFHLLSEQWTADNRHLVQSAEKRSAAASANAQQYRDRMRALYEVAFTLSTTTNANSVLQTLLGECAKIVPYRVGAVLLPTETRDEIGVAAGRNLMNAEFQARFVVGSGALDTILRGGNGGMLPGAAALAEFGSVPTLTACRTLLLLPLRSTNRTYGVVVLGSDDAQLTAEQMEMATTLVSYGMVALQNARLIGELRLERDTLVAREDEMRRQLNRDLHDGPAQALAAITMNLEFVKRLLEHEPQRVPEELDRLARMSQRANHDVRTLLFELRPMTLDGQGLVPTLRLYFERFKDSSTKIILESNDDLDLLDKSVQAMLFNITQEAVNNALKHAQATHLWIRLSRANNHVSLVVEDDGKGFDLKAVRESYDERGSFGLINIEERARLVNGVAELRSTPGGGTTIRISIPLD